MNTLAYNRASKLEISSIEGPSKCSLKDEPAIDYILTNSIFRDMYSVTEAMEHIFTGLSNLGHQTIAR